MSERMTNILGYLTLAAILAAIWILFGEDPSRDQGARGEHTFSGLAERINETTTITLSKSDQSVTLYREGEDWRVASKSDYPADDAQVREFLRGFALSERREPKTANQDRFPLLELGALATLVTLEDDTGGPLLEVQIGKRKEGGGGRSLTYIFQPTDTRAWLVSEIEEASLDTSAWLDDSLFDVAEDRIRSVTLNGVTLARPLGETNFTVSGMADGEAPVATYKRAEPARTLARLSLLDVQQTTNPLMEPAASGGFITHDGLQVSFTLFESGNDKWIQLAADHNSDQASEGATGTLPDAPEDGAAEAQELNAKLRGWLFKISDFDANILMQTRADFVESQETDVNAS